ncbi:MAG: hypothetical protein JSV33_02345 [bacterium]|nr:MAG: hypothetical protein JSV33_02345 [bacterium]
MACDTCSVFVDDCSFVETMPPTPGPNLLVNPSFDGDLSGWTAFANTYPEGRNYLIRTSPCCAKMYGPFTTPGDVSGIFQKVPGTPYSDYQLDLYSLVICRDGPINESNDDFTTAKIVFLIVNPMKGTALAWDDPRMSDITTFIAMIPSAKEKSKEPKPEKEEKTE